MDSLQHNSKTNKILILKSLIAILLIFITFYLGSESFKYYYKIRNLESGLEIKEIKSTELSHSLKQKEKELEELNSDWGKEEYLRKTYKVAAPEEKVMVVVESTSTNDFEIIDDSTLESDFWNNLGVKVMYYFNRYINL